MELTVHGHNIDLDDPTQDYVTRKLERLDRHLSAIRSAAVVVNHQSTRRVDQRYTTQITLNVDGAVLRSEQRAATPMASIDAAIETLDSRIQRFKTREVRDRVKHAGATNSIRLPTAEAPVQVLETEEEAVESPVGNIVRTKRHQIRPMSVDDAILQMDLLGHAFSLFLNAEDNTYSVVYRRDDGDYGLIVPDER